MTEPMTLPEAERPGAQMTFRTCELCGHTGDVRLGIVQFKPELVAADAEPKDGAYQAIDHCRNHRECRDRIEAKGQPWPLVR